jgi:hypothetical protein
MGVPGFDMGEFGELPLMVLSRVGGETILYHNFSVKLQTLSYEWLRLCCLKDEFLPLPASVLEFTFAK